MNVEAWRQRARQLKQEVYALYLAYKHPRVPWYAKVFLACLVGYALSPIDLIPDPIPVLGQLDDLIEIPLGVMLAVKLIPDDVLAECREKAQSAMSQRERTSWIAAGVIVGIWVLVAAAVVFGLLWLFPFLGRLAVDADPESEDPALQIAAEGPPDHGKPAAFRAPLRGLPGRDVGGKPGRLPHTSKG